MSTRSRRSPSRGLHANGEHFVPKCSIRYLCTFSGKKAGNKKYFVPNKTSVPCARTKMKYQVATHFQPFIVFFRLFYPDTFRNCLP